MKKLLLLLFIFISFTAISQKKPVNTHPNYSKPAFQGNLSVKDTTGLNIIYFYDKTSGALSDSVLVIEDNRVVWRSINDLAPADTNFWKKVGTKLYPRTLTDSVGININSPETNFDINGNSSVRNNLGVGTVEPANTFDVNGNALFRADVNIVKNGVLNGIHRNLTLDTLCGILKADLAFGKGLGLFSSYKINFSARDSINFNPYPIPYNNLNVYFNGLSSASDDKYLTIDNANKLHYRSLTLAKDLWDTNSVGNIIQRDTIPLVGIGTTNPTHKLSIAKSATPFRADFSSIDVWGWLALDDGINGFDVQLNDSISNIKTTSLIQVTANLNKSSVSSYDSNNTYFNIVNVSYDKVELQSLRNLKETTFKIDSNGISLINNSKIININNNKISGAMISDTLFVDSTNITLTYPDITLSNLWIFIKTSLIGSAPTSNDTINLPPANKGLAGKEVMIVKDNAGTGDVVISIIDGSGIYNTICTMNDYAVLCCNGHRWFWKNFVNNCSH